MSLNLTSQFEVDLIKVHAFKQEIFSHGIHNGRACFLDYLREKPRIAKVNNAGKNGSFSKEYRSYLLDVKGKALKQ